MAQTTVTPMRFKSPAIFVCDLQEKFRDAIHEFDKVVKTTEKLLTFAKAASIPVYATTQYAAKLGPTVPTVAAKLASTTSTTTTTTTTKTYPVVDKTRFSMIAPEPDASNSNSNSNSSSNPLAVPSQVALVGIESHICITQTALDLRDAGHDTYVIADGVSSCNWQEVVVALDRLRAEPGIRVTSSESWMYECLGDAAHPTFKHLAAIVKAASEDTKTVLATLPPVPKI